MFHSNVTFLSVHASLMRVPLSLCLLHSIRHDCSVCPYPSQCVQIMRMELQLSQGGASVQAAGASVQAIIDKNMARLKARERDAEIKRERGGDRGWRVNQRTRQ